MTDKVLIRIKGYQSEQLGATFSEMEEGAEIIASGNYYERNGHTYIIYEIYEEEEKQTSKNMMKWSEDSVEIHQNGYAQSDLCFKEGVTDRSVYCTPAGELSMETKTLSLVMKKQEDVMEAEIEYELGINGMFVSMNHVSIYISNTK